MYVGNANKAYYLWLPSFFVLNMNDHNNYSKTHHIPCWGDVE